MKGNSLKILILSYFLYTSSIAARNPSICDFVIPHVDGKFRPNSSSSCASGETNKLAVFVIVPSVVSES